MKIFGREPTLWISVLTSLILVAGTIGLHWLSGPQAALMVAAINAVAAAINAYAVRPISPAIFTYAVGAIVALTASYGYDLSIETVAGLNVAVISILGLLTRGQVSAQDTKISESTGY